MDHALDILFLGVTGKFRQRYQKNFSKQQNAGNYISKLLDFKFFFSEDGKLWGSIPCGEHKCFLCSTSIPSMPKTASQNVKTITWKKPLVASKCSHKTGSSSTTYLATSFAGYLDKLEKPTSLSWRTFKI